MKTAAWFHTRALKVKRIVSEVLLPENISLCTLILTLFLCYSGDEHVRWAGHGLCAKEGEEAANETVAACAVDGLPTHSYYCVVAKAICNIFWDSSALFEPSVLNTLKPCFTRYISAQYQLHQILDVS